MNNNSIEIAIENNQEININVQEDNQSIDIDPQEQNNIDISIQGEINDISMSIAENSNMDFEMGDAHKTYNDYRKALNKPSINNVVLIDNKTSEDLGLQPAGSYANSKISNIEIDALFR